jgi:F0F1-type ATP synthase assembly protein I
MSLYKKILYRAIDPIWDCLYNYPLYRIAAKRKMDKAYAGVLAGVRKILFYQVFLIAILASALYYSQHIEAVWAVSLGGLIAIMNVLSSYFWVWLADLTNKSPESLKGDVAFFYIGAMQRFVTTLLFFILGFVWLKLPPLAILAGFGVAQVAYVLGLKKSSGESL